MSSNTPALPATARMKDIYDAIVAFRAANGRSPMLRELCVATHINSKGRMHVLLKALKERGLIDWQPTIACSIVVLSRTSYELPVALQQRLDAFCARTQQHPLAVITDLVELHLDEAEPDADEIRGGGHIEAPFKRSVSR